jgi:hypothetical protein
MIVYRFGVCIITFADRSNLQGAREIVFNDMAAGSLGYRSTGFPKTDAEAVKSRAFPKKK